MWLKYSGVLEIKALQNVSFISMRRDTGNARASQLVLCAIVRYENIWENDEGPVRLLEMVSSQVDGRYPQ